MPTHYNGSEEERLALDVFIKLMRASEAVAVRAGRSVVAAGLTPSQFGVLEALYHLGPMMPSELARRQLKSRNNITVVVDNLEREGLVRRERSTDDRRAFLISLTETGRERIAAVFPTHVQEVVREVGVLTSGEQRQLNDLLRRLGRGRDLAEGE